MMCFLINRAFQRVPLRRGGELKAFLGSRAGGFLEEGHFRRGVLMQLRGSVPTDSGTTPGQNGRRCGELLGDYLSSSSPLSSGCCMDTCMS